MKISLEKKSALHLLIVIAIVLYMPVGWAQEPDTTDPHQNHKESAQFLARGNAGRRKTWIPGSL